MSNAIRYRELLPLLAACGILSFSTAALAAEPPQYSLGEIVVSAPEDGVEATQTVRKVGEDEIQLRNARTLNQAISLLPGVNVRTGGEGVPRIDMRGFRTRHVLLLLDGVPMNSALDQQFDPTLIPTESIAEVKVTFGPSSVLYGQGGLGGVINVITKKGVRGVQGFLGVETGDGEPYLVRTTLSGAVSKWNYFLSGSATKIDGFPLSEGFDPVPEQGKGLRKNSDQERNNFLGTVGFIPHSDLALEFTLSYGEGSYGKPTSIINDLFDPFASGPKYVRVDRFENTVLQLAADYSLSDSLSLRGWGFLNKGDEDATQYDDGSLNSFTRSGSFRAHTETTLQGVTLQPKYALGKWGTVSLSLAAEEDRWETGGVTATGLASPVFAPLDEERSFDIYSAGVEYEVSPLTGLGLVLGYGHYWQERDERGDDDYSLLAGVSYQPVQGTRLKGAFKRGVRFPSLGDLYDLSKGNSALAPERSYTYEAGVEQELGADVTAGLTVFHTEAKNLIQNDQATARNVNLAKVRFTGLEVSAAVQPVKKLLVRGNYAYLHSEDLSRAGREEQQYTPEHKVSADLRYDFDFGLTPYASVIYLANQYFYTKNNVAVVQKSKLNNYALLNLKVSQQLFDRKMTLYVGADNVLDENYESSYGIPQAGRFIYGGVEFRL